MHVRRVERAALVRRRPDEDSQGRLVGKELVGRVSADGGADVPRSQKRAVEAYCICVESSSRGAVRRAQGYPGQPWSGSALVRLCVASATFCYLGSGFVGLGVSAYVKNKADMAGQRGPSG